MTPFIPIEPGPQGPQGPQGPAGTGVVSSVTQADGLVLTAGDLSFVPSNLPTLNQDTTGTSAGLSGTIPLHEVYAGPSSGSPGVASFRSLVATDIPTLNQDTTGTSAGISGVQVPHAFLAGPSSGSVSAVSGFRAIVSTDIPTLNQSTSGSAGSLSGTIPLHEVYAGPSSGSPGVATFRSLVANDIPSLSYAPTAGSSSVTTLGTVTSGAWHSDKIGLAYGGTNADLHLTGGSGQYLKQVTAGADISVGTISSGDIPTLPYLSTNGGTLQGIATPITSTLNISDVITSNYTTNYLCTNDTNVATIALTTSGVDYSGLVGKPINVKNFGFPFDGNYYVTSTHTGDGTPLGTWTVELSLSGSGTNGDVGNLLISWTDSTGSYDTTSYPIAVNFDGLGNPYASASDIQNALNGATSETFSVSDSGLGMGYSFIIVNNTSTTQPSMNPSYSGADTCNPSSSSPYGWNLDSLSYATPVASVWQTIPPSGGPQIINVLQSVPLLTTSLGSNTINSIDPFGNVNIIGNGLRIFNIGTPNADGSLPSSYIALELSYKPNPLYPDTATSLYGFYTMGVIYNGISSTPGISFGSNIYMTTTGFSDSGFGTMYVNATDLDFGGDGSSGGCTITQNGETYLDSAGNFTIPSQKYFTPGNVSNRGSLPTATGSQSIITNGGHLWFDQPNGGSPVWVQLD